MRLRAGLGLLCVGLAGCQHVPDGVDVDLRTGVVTVGPCTCRLPAREAVAVPAEAAGRAMDVPALGHDAPE